MPGALCRFGIGVDQWILIFAGLGRKRPVAASGAVAALALFIAREPLMELAGKLMSGSKKKKVKKAAKPKGQVEKVDE